MPTAKSARDLQVYDPVLTNLVRAHQPSGFIAEQVAPTIKVEKDSGQYPIYAKESLFGNEVDSRVTDRSETPEIDFEWSTDTYLCEDYRLKVSLTKKEKRQARNVIELEKAKLITLKNRMLLSREVRVAAMLRKTTNGGQLSLGAGVSNKWNTAAATIEADIKTAAVAVYDAIGKSPTHIVLPWKVAYEVALQEDIREIVKYTVPGTQLLQAGSGLLPPELHGLKLIIPKGTLQNTAAEGATASLSDIWSDSVRLLTLPESAGWGELATANTFSSEDEVVDRWEDKDPPVEFIRYWNCMDEKVCAPESAYEINDVL